MAAKPQTVLVVEDEASIASFVAAYLKNAGYAVRTTASGNEALKLVDSEKPALVVLDLMLADIDGTGDNGLNDGVMSIDNEPYQSLPDFWTAFTLGSPAPGS